MTDLEMVKFSYHNLEGVKNQTPEVCLAAINKSGYALQYVKKQTPEMCLMAIRQNRRAVQYISFDLLEKVLNSFVEPKNKINNHEKYSRFDLMDLE